MSDHHGHTIINMVYKSKESETQVWKPAQRPKFWNKQDCDMYICQIMTAVNVFEDTAWWLKYVKLLNKFQTFL